MDAPQILKKNNVRVLGPADALRTLVFVHGFGTDQSVWNAVAAGFVADCRVVVLDNAGAGGSDPRAFVQHRYLDLRGYADDLSDVLDAVAARDAVLIGHSFGGVISALAANRRPDRVAKLVLIGTSPRFRNDAGYPGGMTDEAVNDVYSAMTHNYPEWADRFAPEMMGNAHRPELARHLASSLRAIPASHALTVLYTILQSDHRAEMARIACPTLLVYSRHDAAVPPGVAEFMHATIPGSRLVVIDADGHLPHVSAPAAVTAAIDGFVRD
jgi:sigma-B regulation protein RsbQ